MLEQIWELPNVVIGGFFGHLLLDGGLLTSSLGIDDRDKCISATTVWPPGSALEAGLSRTVWPFYEDTHATRSESFARGREPVP